MVTGWPTGVETFQTAESADLGTFYRIPRERLLPQAIHGLRLPGVKRFLALNRPDYWSYPVKGTNDFSGCQQTQFLLLERENGTLGLLLPLVDGDVRATLDGSGDSLTLTMKGALPQEEPASAVLLFAASGRDPYTLLQRSLLALSRQMGTFRLREEKCEPAFLDYFGWCTWDAFRHEVDAEKVLAGLEAFKKGGVQPGFMILDDGWLDTVGGDFLNDIPANHKFPGGLKPLVDKAKREYGLKMFLAWVCFEGYWAGLNPQGALAKRLRILSTQGNIRTWCDQGVIPLHLMDERDVPRFFEEQYDYLRRQGVDGVKVDGQSGLDVFTAGLRGRVSTMRTWQHAMQGAVHVHFAGNVIHCMSHGSDVAYNMLSTNCWRNSQDFFPHDPASHGLHVHYNAMAALWTSWFSVPDWDMFWSGNPEGAFHAAARAISGGPVYVSDQPGGQDFELLKKLTISGGRVLRCSRPALPTRDSIFKDCIGGEGLLKVTNRNGEIGVLGLFNCTREKEIADAFSPADVHDMEGELFAAYGHKTGALQILQRKETETCRLPALGYEIVTLSPVQEGWIAPLGLLDKFNGSGAVRSGNLDQEGTFTALLQDGGRIGFYCAKKPAKVTVNGQPAKIQYEPPTGLLELHAPAGRVVEVSVQRPG